MVSGRIKSVVSFFSLAIVLLFIMVLFSQTLGLFARGFDSEEVLKQFFFYVAPGIGFLVGLVLVFIIELFITEDDSELGSSIAFASPGEFPALGIFKRYSQPHIFFLSAILFSLVGIFAVIRQQISFAQNTTFTGLIVLPQQFTAGSSTLFSAALIATSENLGAAFLIAFLFMVIRIIGRKTNMSKGTFFALSYIVIPILTGVYGIANHLLRYGSQEANLITVFLFWLLGGLITVATGSFIPFWNMHILNNLLFDITRLLSNESIVLGIAGAVVLFAILGMVIWGPGGFWIGKNRE